MEFAQIDHEKYFKFVMRGLFILITVWNVLLFMLAEIIEPGALYARVGFLTGDMLVEQEYYLIILGNVVTGLAMVTAEICACVMKLRNASTIIHPVCSVEFIVNHIPFFTLNFSIVLVLVVQTVTVVFFEFRAPFWLNASVVLTTILVTNKGARAHVATRLRQQIDSFTIGGNNANHQVVEIALVPLRSLAGPAPTLPTSTIAGPALVRFSKPLALGSGLENLTIAGQALVEVGSVGADPARLLSGTRAISTTG